MSSDNDDHDNNRARAAIIARYDRGYDDGAEVDDWEDANFFIYKVTDRYGFLHKNPLPDELDPKMVAHERIRILKWVKMTKHWDKYIRGEKLRKRVYKGIPNSLRGDTWKRLLGLENIPNRTATYEMMKKIARAQSPDVRQIDLDVNRTYRDHIMFRERFGIKQQALFHVLAAYSMYNVEVGYCQGMSGIAAILLMYLNEEDAFWALSIMLTGRKHSMHGLFIPGFPKLLRFQEHHDRILKKLAPRLFKHLEKEGCHTSLYTLKWFMQCFLDRLPFSLTLRVYDIFMLEGDRVLTAMAYNIMKMHKKIFSKMNLEEVVQFLQESMHAYPYDDDEVVELLQSSMFELKKIGLDVPPPPKKDELPQLPPGASLKRGTFQTASARARKNKERDKIIAVPVARPPSPESPRRISPIKGLPTRPESPHYSESEMSMMSMSTINDTQSIGQGSRTTVVHAERPRMSSIDMDMRPLETRTSRREQYSEHRKSDGNELDEPGFSSIPAKMSYHSESVLVRRDGVVTHHLPSRQPAEKPMSTFRPINGDIDALNGATKPDRSPVWRTRNEMDSSYQEKRKSTNSLRGRAESQTSVNSVSSQISNASFQNMKWETSKASLYEITEL
ncbi:hypothetical protein QZH41_014819 [Actinostola sp. cb2023]|nr:hypothetical protein QZH41_014819 [Actinostola sp. cb2023]